MEAGEAQVHPDLVRRGVGPERGHVDLGGEAGAGVVLVGAGGPEIHQDALATFGQHPDRAAVLVLGQHQLDDALSASVVEVLHERGTLESQDLLAHPLGPREPCTEAHVGVGCHGQPARSGGQRIDERQRDAWPSVREGKRKAVAVVEGVLEVLLGRGSLVLRAQPSRDPVRDRDPVQRRRGDGLQQARQLRVQGVPVVVVAADRRLDQVWHRRVQNFGEVGLTQCVRGVGEQLPSDPDRTNPVCHTALVVEVTLVQGPVVVAREPPVDHGRDHVEAATGQQRTHHQTKISAFVVRLEAQPELVPEGSAEHPRSHDQVADDLRHVLYLRADTSTGVGAPAPLGLAEPPPVLDRGRTDRKV